MKKRLRRLLALLLCICMLLPAAGALGISPEEAVARVGEEIVRMGETAFADGRVQSVAANGSMAAITEDGSLWMWGGDGVPWSHDKEYLFSVYTPRKVMENVATVSAGSSHYAVIKTDGSLWMWGYNGHGCLGNPDIATGATVRVPFRLMTDVAAVSLGNYNSAAIKTDGSLYVWGNARYGALGIGIDTEEPQLEPVKILDDVKAVSLGSTHGAAVKTNGDLYIWGSNYFGSLGTGNYSQDEYAPTCIMHDVATVSCSSDFSAAIKTDGSLWMWGHNDEGQLGNNTTENVQIPFQLMEDVAALSLGSMTAAAVKTDGSLYVWGDNRFGQQGTGKGVVGEYQLVPRLLLENVEAVSVSDYASAALKKDGSLWVWGTNSQGQLGNGTTSSSSQACKPTRVSIAGVKIPRAPVVIKTQDDLPLDGEHLYLRVVDRRDRRPISGAAVTLTEGGEAYTTNAQGVIAIPGSEARRTRLRINASGYHAYNAVSGIYLQPKRVLDLPLAPESDTTGIAQLLCDGVDILSHPVSAEHNKIGSWTLEAQCTLSDAREVHLLCDGKIVGVIPRDGTLSLPAEKLKVGRSVWAQLVKSDGTSLEPVKTRLSVYNPTLLPGVEQDFSLKIGSGLEVTMPNDVPILGGKAFKLDWGYLPVAVEVEEDTLRVGFGIAGERDDDPNSPTYKKVKNKTLLDKMEKLSQSDKSASKVLKEFKKLGAKSYAQSKLSKSLTATNGMIDLDIYVFGYGEWKFPLGYVSSSASELRVLVEAKWFEHSWQTAVWVVPLAIEFELGSKLDGKLRGEVDTDTGAFSSQTTLKITPLYVKPTASIGIVKVATVGVYGKGSFNVGFGPMEGYHYGELEGEAGARARFLLFTEEWPFWKDRLELWSHYPGSTRSVSEPLNRSASPFNAQGQIASDGFRLAERGYLGAQSAWRGGGSAAPGLVRSNGDSPMRTTRALQTSVYGDARVRMGRVGADTLLVWLQDDAGRSAQNRTKLVYALYDASTGVWSEPAAVWDDGTADFMPALGTDGSSLYVAWQDSKTEFASGVTLAQMAAAGEISLARFDTASKTFVDAKRLTDNDVLDTNPAVAAFHGTAHVAWSRNAANDILNQSGGNDILYYDGSGESVSASGRGPLLALEIGDVSGAVQIAYVEDGDGQLQSADDQYLYLGTPGGSPTQMQAGAQNPRMGYLGGSGRLFYAENGALMQSAGGMGAAVEGFADTVYGFELINGTANDTAILTIEPKAEQDGSDVYVHTYESAAGTWSGAVQLSVTSAYAESPDGVILENGAILSVFTRTAASVGADDVSTSSDLCESLLQRAYDLAITDVSYDEAAVGSDAALAVEITVENRGALGVSGVQLNMAAGDGAAAPITLNQSIPAGGSALLFYDLAMPETITPTSYTVSVEPVGGTDADPGDNTMAVVIGYTDLALHVRQVGTGSVVGAEVEVENISASATEATLCVRDGSTAGEVLGKLDMGSIAPGTRASAYIDGTEVSQMRAMAASDTLCIEVVSAVPEESTVDNSATIEAEKKLLTYMKLGDANGDGAISLADAVRLAQIVTKAYTETDPNAYAALDIDMDDEITVLDVIYVCRYLVGIRD